MTSSDKPIVVWHNSAVSTAARERLNGHRGGVLWFTGLSGSGKSTIANRVDELLYARRCHTTVLDGDNIRHGLCATAAQLERDYSSEYAKRFGLGFLRKIAKRISAELELPVSLWLRQD